MLMHEKTCVIPVINPDLDTNNYLHMNTPRARNEVLDSIIEEDVFRYIYNFS